MLSIINIIIFLFSGVNSNTDSLVMKYLNNNLNNYNRFSYEVVSPKNIDLSKLRIDESREFKLSKNYGYIPIEMDSKNGKQKNSLLTIRLELYQNVLVANRRISKKEYLSKSDFVLIEKEVSLLRHEPLTEYERISIFRAKLNIAEKSVLQKSMVEKIPDIQLGDRVEAIYSKGIVNVNFPVIARSEGIAGDIIKVKRDDRKMFRARILNNNNVKIVE